ncbi:MAG: pirin family protein [Labilithrix sp.]|nr:pirin family protein [Labilithrix sp.]
MSGAFEPVCEDHPADAIELVIRARPRDVGGFAVRRVLPSMRRRLVGPFVFFDHMGPVDLPAGAGMDVPPHPHIGLATVTYLLEGVVFHRDSLGTAMAIHPGDVNWMIAGRGIVHSERTPPEARATGHRSHGLQAWVALREEEEELEPRFVHHPASSLPRIARQGVDVRLVSGRAYGAAAPTPTLTPTIYADAKISAGASLDVPGGYEQRAVYVVSGAVECGETAGGARADEGAMLVLRPGADVRVRATTDARVMILGGAPIDGERFIWWNFVSSSKERIERAKQGWEEGRFPKVPGDEAERVPLPDT